MSPLPGYRPDLLAGSRVLVTGAAGGIGQAIAAAFRAVGAELVLLDRAEALAGAAAAGGTPLPCDLADRAELRRAAREAERRGPLAALVHCAGVFRRAPMGGADAEAAWDEALAVNLSAPFLLTRALLPALRGGAVVHVTSTRADTAAADAPAYTASKGGLAALTAALAVDLAPQGVRVNAVAPGDTATPMSLGDAASEALLARVPLGRRAMPEEVAAAVVFLASPLAAFVTGATLHVDGGFRAA